MDWFPEINAPKRRARGNARKNARGNASDATANDEGASFAEFVPFDGGGRAYTYRVPAKFEGKIAQGSLVKIPLGKRVNNFGVVWKMGVVPADSWREKVRDIAELCFDIPVLTPDALRLCEWISAYYAAPFNSVLQTILPATVRRGVRPVVEKKIAIARELSEEELQKLRRHAPKQAQLYEILKQRADAAARHTASSAGTPPPAP